MEIDLGYMESLYCEKMERHVCREVERNVCGEVKRHIGASSYCKSIA
jgi:hypothetical protein